MEEVPSSRPHALLPALKRKRPRPKESWGMPFAHPLASPLANASNVSLQSMHSIYHSLPASSPPFLAWSFHLLKKKTKRKKEKSPCSCDYHNPSPFHPSMWRADDPYPPNASMVSARYMYVALGKRTEGRTKKKKN